MTSVHVIRESIEWTREGLESLLPLMIGQSDDLINSSTRLLRSEIQFQIKSHIHIFYQNKASMNMTLIISTMFVI